MNKSLKVRLCVVLFVLVSALFGAFPLENMVVLKDLPLGERFKQSFDVTQRINLGLDLKGGMHLVLHVDTDSIEDADARRDAVPRAIEILRNRIDSMGVGEPVIQLQGENQIIVQLPGVTDRNSALKVIGQVAQLHFSLVEESPLLMKAALEGDVPEGYELKAVRGKTDTVLIHKQPVMAGAEIADARVDFDSDGFGQPKIALSFKSEGAKQFADVTRANINRRLAIVMDGQVLSAPNINEAILSGRAEISGSFTYEDAALLALALRSGSLPAPMTIEEERTIGPLLGRDSINAGINAIVTGGVILFFFMLLYYLKAGVISNIALALNLVAIIGIMGLLKLLLPDAQVTLTLPGIAGIILTLGMAVDANILINERIREELENGQTLRTAINTGFGKALKAIIDANATTLIAAFMLFQFGSGPVKGFAVTLSIGLIASLFTAVFVTRTLYAALLEWNLLKTLPMMKIFSKSQFNFVNKRFICITISAALLVFTMVNFVRNYDKAFGIDFAGGQVQEYRFARPVDSEDLRRRLEGAGLKDFVLQRFEQSPETVLIRTREDTYDQVAAVLSGEMADNPFEILRIEKVGPLVGNELRRKAVLAVVFALAGILVFVGFRYNHFDFATAGVIALLHDVLLTLGLIVLMGRQIDLLVVTALLTIAGYSINDTIIVYDRIRENFLKMKKASLAEIINVSINQTISRTILTTVTTLIVVAALFFKGGDVLNTFALCLMIGFVTGTYSTIFIASPLVLAWQKKGKK